MENPRKIAIIGGGAAGFFAAMSAKKHHPEAHVIIFEKGSKVLGKVKVSGGGRCNVTHNQTNIKELAKNYPRGEKFLRKAFSQFSVTDTISWFEKRGVKLKIESDNRMFPQSNSSQTIIDTFLKEVQTLGVEVRKGVAFNDLVAAENGLRINLSSGEMLSFDAVIIALGGQKSLEKYEAFSQLGHKILTPVPSLFTFNIADSKIMELMGTVASSVIIKIQGTKLQNQGPLLITHWGMSGPAVLKLSSLAARELAERNYEFTVQINWLGEAKEDDVRNQLAQFIKENGKKQVNKKAFDLPNKLWHFFISELGLEAELTWNTLDKKSKNRLINKILNDTYTIHKKTTFKEEFVICGGVSLADLNVKTMESKILQVNLWI